MGARRKGGPGWGGARRGAGRPALEAEKRQDAGLLVRLYPAELEALRGLAVREGATVGVYARRVLRRHLGRARRS